jgi:hypothetical protein
MLELRVNFDKNRVLRILIDMRPTEMPRTTTQTTIPIWIAQPADTLPRGLAQEPHPHTICRRPQR